MPLTAKDILGKTFKKSFKGYDEDEVDMFLDQIIDEFNALQDENTSLKETLAAKGKDGVGETFDGAVELIIKEFRSLKDENVSLKEALAAKEYLREEAFDEAARED